MKYYIVLIIIIIAILLYIRIAFHQPYSIRNANFQNGTYRITKPGYYILNECVVFDPDPNMLIQYQNIPHIGRAYSLGFFAAITIECDNVILDMNGFSIKQSDQHYKNQRFFTCIELGHSPFMSHQGPIPFTSSFRGVTHTTIKNGTLKQSSHHGIHGNVGHDITISNMKICEFEVGGIALNGCTNVHLEYVDIGPSAYNVPVNSFFSHINTLRQFIQLHQEEIDINTRITLHNGNVLSYNTIMYSLTHISEEFIHPFDTVPEGNIYGIVLTSAGAVINALPDTQLTSQKHVLGNHGVTINDVTIHDIRSTPIETPGLQSIKHNTEYGLQVQKDNVGALFQFEQCTRSDGMYEGNVVSDAQLWLTLATIQHTKHVQNHTKCPFGRTTFSTSSIQDYVIQWATQSTYILSHYHIPYTIIYGGDTMSHVFKGNIGILINQSYDCSIYNTSIYNIDNTMIHQSTYSHNTDKHVRAENTFGILVNASTTVSIDANIYDIKSLHGDAYDIYYTQM